MMATRKGVSLVEIVIALGILSIALLGLVATFTSGLKLAQVSNEVTTATTVGQEFLELVKARGYTQTATGTYDGRVPDPAASVGFPFAPYPTVKRNNQEYALVVTCSDVTTTIRDVRVDVYWEAQRESNISFYTRIHQ
jgi:prepilin-type N-terminal cleavage/methylation domain-containing protein